MPVALRAMLGAAGYAPPSGGGGGPDGTQYYVEVTIAASEVSSTLTDFPVYVDLSDLPAAFFTNVQSDGGDIRVTESDGTTRCATELVAINTGSSTGELHFLASSISSSSDTVFRIYYDGGGSTLSQPGVATTYGRNAVWSDYVGVWHMGDDPSGTAPQMVDSTGNGHDGTSFGTMTSGDVVATQLGDGLDFDGSNDYISMGTDTALQLALGGASWTLSAWVKTDSTSLQAIGGRLSFGGGDNGLEQWGVYHSGASGFTAVTQDATNGQARSFVGSVASTGVDYHVAGVYDGTDIEVVVDSVGQGATSAASHSPSTSGERFVLGIRESANGVYWNGTMDEVRARQSALSADWISAEYTNQNTPTTFYTIGSQQAA